MIKLIRKWKLALSILGVLGTKCALAEITATGIDANKARVAHTSVFQYYPTGPDITYFRASWTVPPEPTVRNGQEIAIWIGLAPEDSTSGILQPVLQWGPWGNGGSERWALACWSVNVDKGSHARFVSSDPTPVRPGERVTAVIELISKEKGAYTYKCSFEGRAETAVIWKAPGKLNTAWFEYEMQNMKTCRDFVSEVTFTDVELRSDRSRLSGKWLKAPISGSHAQQAKRCGMRIMSSGDGPITIGPPR